MRLDSRANLRTKAGGERRLVRDDEAARLLDRIAHRLHVPRHDRGEVDAFARVALRRGALRRLEHHVHLRAPRDERDVGALGEHVGLAEGQHEVARRHLLHGGSVQDLRLEEDARVAVADAREEQALGGDRVARVHHLEAGRVRKIGLRRLRVVVAAVADGARRRADGETADVELAARAVPELGRLVADLVHRREDVVGELHLGDRRASDGRHPNAKADEALLVDRHVEHAILAELVEQPHRAAEHAAERHVLTEDDGARVGRERDAHRIVDGREHGHLAGGRIDIGGGRREVPHPPAGS
mmetsp:Transcript_70287/g.186938  ORF Transcript_70287/g.186938 Transcript_70287/m.186938 type:complete len:300 (-) Transcript_70287:78-977(-)